MTKGMQSQFSRVPKAEIPRSSFDRSSKHMTTFDAGFLVPIFIDEVLPGDTFNLRTSFFGRLATPIHPIMDNIYLDTFFFFVPNRLVWTNWEKFNGAQDDPGDSTDFVIPTIGHSASGHTNSIFDYFGIPPITGLNINALPFRGYNLIWNEWFRDQNLQDSVTVNTADGTDPNTDYTLKRRGKRHDYFTSALPWPQKGDAVDLPLGSIAPVYGDGSTSLELTGAIGTQNVWGTAGSPYSVRQAAPTVAGGSQELRFPTAAEGETGLQADLSNATAATINQLRQAFQIQKLLERDARGGTRYTEIVKAHFGVTSPDARLQRPEYLGGGTQRVNITPVAQTSETNTTPQGALAGFGTVSGSGHGFTKSFTEHGYIIGLACARADLTYQQGLERMWSRSTRYDFFWPALSHIGEQAILNKEIYAQGTSVDDDAFGFQERHAEYRYKPARLSGLFRSDAASSLDPWHLAEDFGGLPVLNSSFIEENPPIDRAIAVPAEPHFIADWYFDLRCARPMPMHGVPGLIDHF